MSEGDVLGPGPHVLVEDVLVGPLILPGGECELVLQYPVPGASPQPPDDYILQPRAPHPSQHGGGVAGGVPHHVHGGPGVQPLLHRGQLPPGEAAVQVPAHHDVHLGVQGGEEPPDLGVNFTGINFGCSR